MEILKYSIAGLPAFGLYLAASFALLALFVWAYARVTPYKEFALIREGNTAAAASITGAMLGFVIPLANAIIHSANVADMVMWGLIALVVQLIVYWVVSRLIPDLAHGIPQGKVSQGIFLGAL